MRSSPSSSMGLYNLLHKAFSSSHIAVLWMCFWITLPTYFSLRMSIPCGGTFSRSWPKRMASTAYLFTLPPVVPPLSSPKTDDTFFMNMRVATPDDTVSSPSAPYSESFGRSDIRSPPEGDFFATELGLSDLPEIFRLATLQFLPKCSGPSEKADTVLSILSLFIPKLLLKSFMGYSLLGLKCSATNKLLGFVDLSLQRCCGSMDALKVRSLYQRKQMYPQRGQLQPYLCNLLVDRQHRRRGLGKALVSECQRLAQQWGYSQINLHVEAASIPALSLYIHEGFCVEKTLGSGTSRILFMRKTFSSRARLTADSVSS